MIIDDDTECQLSVGYPNKKRAQDAALAKFTRTGKLHKVEYCRYCREYHLKAVRNENEN